MSGKLIRGDLFLPFVFFKILYRHYDKAEDDEDDRHDEQRDKAHLRHGGEEAPRRGSPAGDKVI